MCNKADITLGSKISDSCRKKLARVPDLDTLPVSPRDCGFPTDKQYFDALVAVASVNRCLLEIGESPLPPATKDFKRIDSRKDRLAVATKGLILEGSANVDTKENNESEILIKLKKKFRVTCKRSEKVQILSFTKELDQETNIR